MTRASNTREPASESDVLQKRPTRTRQPEQVRARILMAAMAAFTRDGFAGARLRSIAEDAGITVQLLLYHTVTKEELWLAVMEDALQKFEDIHTADPLPKNASLRERLHRFIADVVHFTSSMPLLLRIMTQEAGQLTPRLVWFTEKRTRRLFEEFCDLATEGRREGAVRDIDPARLYYGVLAIASMPFSVAAEYEYLTGRNPFTESEIEGTIKLIADLVFIEQ